MRIVIDYQGAHRTLPRGANAWGATSLAQALVHAAQDHEIILVLDGRFAHSVDEAMTQFAGAVARSNMHVWYPPPRPARNSPTSYSLARKKLYEAFIASLRPDVTVVAIGAPVSQDGAPVGIGNFVTMPTAVILPDDLSGARAHVGEIRRAGIWFATSEAARRDALERLGLDASRCRLVEADDRASARPAAGQRTLEELKLLLKTSAPRNVVAQAGADDRARPRLAWVSPLTPDLGDTKSPGARLLRELAQRYDIDVVVDTMRPAGRMPASEWPMRSADWFREHACAFDHVLYLLGNSWRHAYVPALLDEIPGAVLLRDFDLNQLVPALSESARLQALYASHGYGALAESLGAGANGKASVAYPCNFEVLSQAQGVIVHSAGLVELAHRWFGKAFAQDWAVLDAESPQMGRDHMRAIEGFAAAAAIGRDGLIQSVAEDESRSTSADEAGPEWLEFAQAVADALPDPMPQAQLFIDVSELAQRDSKTGIQRVVKSLLQVLLDDPPPGYRVEPVHATDQRFGYQYARKFTLGFLGAPQEALEDAPLEVRRGDVFIGLDLQPHLIPNQRAYFQRLRHSGVRVAFVVYDLLPILLTHRFSRDAAAVHARWLEVVAENNGALCISQAVADELAAWMAVHAPQRLAEGFDIRAFHLGADLHDSTSTQGLPADAEETLRAIETGTSFLMVGTVEPRKGHALALDAFESLWSEGMQAKLVIAGKQGWMIDELAKRLRDHPERGRRLFWLEVVSDEYLERLYSAASCLLAASEGEGFGLPLIESARHRLPILARDLPVFQEVAGTHALYFGGSVPALAAAVREWLRLFAQGQHPRSEAMPYLSWRQSAEAFKSALLSPQIGDAAPNRNGSRAPALQS